MTEWVNENKSVTRQWSKERVFYYIRRALDFHTYICSIHIFRTYRDRESFVFTFPATLLHTFFPPFLFGRLPPVIDVLTFLVHKVSEVGNMCNNPLEVLHFELILNLVLLIFLLQGTTFVAGVLPTNGESSSKSGHWNNDILENYMVAFSNRSH